MDGLEKISPGRNMQFIPYASVRTFRDLDDRDPNHPHFHGKHIEPRIGLDSKVVIKDAFVLDATINSLILRCNYSSRGVSPILNTESASRGNWGHGPWERSLPTTSLPAEVFRLPIL